MIWWQREVTTKSCWTNSPNILIIKISPCCTCARTCFHLENTQSISRNTHYVIAFKNPRDQLGMKNLLLQTFPSCWKDMMDVYQKVTERPFRYTVLDFHPASDDRKRMFSHLLTHEGYPHWLQRIKKEDVWSLSTNGTLIGLAHLKHSVLGEGRQKPCLLLQQICLAPWQKTMMKT